MRRESPKRAAQNRVYRKRAKEFLEARSACEYPTGCGERAGEVHHRKGRVGALLTDERFWSALCHSHHVYVTEHPAEAYALGISERRIA